MNIQSILLLATILISLPNFTSQKNTEKCLFLSKMGLQEEEKTEYFQLELEQFSIPHCMQTYYVQMQIGTPPQVLNFSFEPTLSGASSIQSTLCHNSKSYHCADFNKLFNPKISSTFAFEHDGIYTVEDRYSGNLSSDILTFIDTNGKRHSIDFYFVAIYNNLMNINEQFMDQCYLQISNISSIYTYPVFTQGILNFNAKSSNFGTKYSPNFLLNLPNMTNNDGYQKIVGITYPNKTRKGAIGFGGCEVHKSMVWIYPHSEIGFGGKISNIGLKGNKLNKLIPVQQSVLHFYHSISFHYFPAEIRLILLKEFPISENCSWTTNNYLFNKFPYCNISSPYDITLFPTIWFNIGDYWISMKPEDYITSVLAGKIVILIASNLNFGESEFSYGLGNYFLRHYYMVWNYHFDEYGLADIENEYQIFTKSPLSGNEQSHSSLPEWAFILIIIGALIILLVLIILFLCCCKWKRKKRNPSENDIPLIEKTDPCAKYKIIRELGIGSFGMAILVQRIADKKFFVKKTIQLVEITPRRINEASREAQLLGELRHPNIISMEEFFIDKKFKLNIILEYAEGGDLCRTIINRKKNNNYFDIRTIKHWLMCLTSGIEYIHSQNIVHRDIKPGNIVIIPSSSSHPSSLKICDLGISSKLDSNQLTMQTIKGTIAYSAPEFFTGTYTYKIDIWSLGCVFYQICTLHHPFEQNILIPKLLVNMITQHEIDFQSFAQMPPVLLHIVKGMLTKLPQQRIELHQVKQMLANWKLDE